MPLSIAYWNVDGLFCRIDNQKFCKLNDNRIFESLSSHDLICLVETHMSPNDVVDLPGYDLFHNIRPKSANAARNYGGISIGIKSTIRKGINLLPNTSSEFSWFKLSKNYFKTKKDIYLAVVYITCGNPASDDIKNENIFNLLEEDIAKFSNLGECLIMGDFNAKTSNLPDYVEDTELDDFPDYICDEPLPRNNCDPHDIDNRGRQLLSLCKSAGVRILNGRTLGDYFGNYTCYSHSGSPSVIDYVLSSVNLRNNIDYIYVNDPGEHSIHCMISCIVATGKFDHCINGGVNEDKTPYFIWSEHCDNQYFHALQQILPSELGDVMDSNNSCHNSTNCVEFISSSLIKAARLAKIKSKKSSLILNSKTKSKEKNPTTKRNKWFDSECFYARKELRRLARLLHANPYNHSLFIKFRTQRKSLKRLLNQKKRKMRQTLLNKLDQLHDNNPRAFWKTFDELRGCQKKNVANSITSDVWINHFSNLMNNVSTSLKIDEDALYSYVKNNMSSVFNELNFSITTTEITTAISKLKKAKACGPDGILNEMLKVGSPLILPYLQRAFNKILSSGIFPDQWRCSFLTPVHKRSDASVPSNYRGIAVGSNLAKLFCSILNNRLSSFCSKNNLIPNCQIGFKAKARTADHIITLKSIVNRYVNKISKKYLFCAFIDFKCAFDTISRKFLIHKLFKLGVGGCFLNCIDNMYSNVQYCVKLQNGVSNSFSSTIGVKQGCVLSPLLFNIFTSDLPNIFDKSCDPVFLNNQKLNCLMFADDLVIFSQSSIGLQNALNKLSSYCDKWYLTVNMSKTKIIVFNSSGHLIKRFTFTFKGAPVLITDSYCYLGVIFTPSGSFSKACDRLCDQAKKALFKLKSWDLRSNIPTALKLFKTLIQPILLYCCEAWGPFYFKKPNPKNFLQLCDSIPQEKILLQFCKYILGVNRRTSNAATRGELGMFPLFTQIISQTAKYWLKLQNFPNSLAYHAYIDPLSNNNINNKARWAYHVKSIWTSFDLENIWLNNGSLYPTKILKLLKNHMNERFCENWKYLIGHSACTGYGNVSSKLRTYKLFKSEFNFENYLSFIKDYQIRRYFTKIRVSAHDLHIETGRYVRPPLPPDQRLCLICKSGVVENEEHFLLHCTMYNNERLQLFSTLDKLISFSKLSDEKKLSFILGYNGDNKIIYKLLVNFISNCFKLRKLC